MTRANTPRRLLETALQRGPAAWAALLLLVAVAVSSACGGGSAEGGSPSPVGDASPTATAFELPGRSPTELELPVRIAVTLPLFEEFAREAGLENVEVISLVPPGADPHSYQFTEQDIESMRGIDFFFLNARGLDSRLQDVIEANRDEDSHVIPFAPNILSPQGGGQTAEEAGDNAHLWLDPSLAYVYVEIVADELIIYDGVRKNSYDANFLDFKQRMLDFQDGIYAQLQVVPVERRKIVTYHDSFDHFARKFEFQIAGYAVDRPDASPAPDTVGRLAQAVRDQGIPAVFAEHGYDSALMDQVGVQAGVPVCTLYSDIVPATLTYEEMMQANADEIVRCLGG